MVTIEVYRFPKHALAAFTEGDQTSDDQTAPVLQPNADHLRSGVYRGVLCIEIRTTALSWKRSAEGRHAVHRIVRQYLDAADGRGMVVLDLQQCDWLDSQLLHLFIDLAKSLAEVGGRLGACNMANGCVETFEICRIPYREFPSREC